MTTRWMSWIALAALLVAPWRARAEAPMVVTTARGSVTLEIDGQETPLPSPPFLVAPGQVLSLREGAMVVVLFQGSATKVLGPRRWRPEDISAGVDGAASDAVGALNDLLTRRVDTSRAGASRAGLRLERPVARTVLLRPRTIRWSCDDCGEQQVQLYDVRADRVVWSATGASQVTYDGPDLEPGAYYLQIGGDPYTINVAPAEERQRVTRALEAARAAAAGLEDDPAAAVSLSATVYLQAGMPSEALYLVDAALAEHPDDPALEGLRADYETRAGLTP